MLFVDCLKVVISSCVVLDLPGTVKSTAKFARAAKIHKSCAKTGCACDLLKATLQVLRAHNKLLSSTYQELASQFFNMQRFFSAKSQKTHVTNVSPTPVALPDRAIQNKHLAIFLNTY